MVIISYVHIKEFSEHITLRPGESKVTCMRQPLENASLICGKRFASEVKPKKIRLVFAVHFGYTCRMSVKNMNLHCTIHAKKCVQMCTILCIIFICSLLLFYLVVACFLLIKHAK